MWSDVPNTCSLWSVSAVEPFSTIGFQSYIRYKDYIYVYYNKNLDLHVVEYIMFEPNPMRMFYLFF